MCLITSKIVWICGTDKYGQYPEVEPSSQVTEISCKGITFSKQTECAEIRYYDLDAARYTWNHDYFHGYVNGKGFVIEDDSMKCAPSNLIL